MKLRENDAVVGRTEFYRVDPRKIHVVNGWNPREMFDAEKLDELKESIKEVGVLVPVRVKVVNDEITLIDGERRLRAVLKAIEEGAKIDSIPAIVEKRNMNEIEMFTLSLTANYGEPLTLIEEAKAMKRLQNYGLTISEISKKLGKAVCKVKARLSLLEASPEVVEELQNKNINYDDVKEILKSAVSLEDQKEQLKNVKDKKANKKNNTKKYGKKDLVSLCSDMLEWLIELNNKEDESIIQVEDIITRARMILDEEDC